MKKDKMDTLKDCPFCGLQGWAGEHPYYVGKYIAHCSREDNDICLFPSTGPQDTLKEAVALWQMRKGAKL